jgi:hypothetical protein
MAMIKIIAAELHSILLGILFIPLLLSAEDSRDGCPTGFFSE